MGTDIYLSWEGQNVEEQLRQYTAFSIAAGDRGYLRASIGMTQENADLRRLFPEAFWEEDVALSFDFAGAQGVLETIVRAYVLGVELETEGDVILARQEAVLEDVHAVFARAGLAEGQLLLAPAPGDRASREVWAASVRAFFALGLRQQRAGLDPRVRISW